MKPVRSRTQKGDKRPVDPAKLRARMSRAVEKLIDAMDAFDAVETDLEDEPDDEDTDREDGGDDEFSFNGDESELDNADDEPALGSDDWAIDQKRWNNLPPQRRADLWSACPIDREQEHDAEPSLGWANQSSQAGLNTLVTDGESECSLAVTEHINQRLSWSERGGDPWSDREHDPSELEPSLPSAASRST